VDIAQPDICYLGGVSRAKRVAEMAKAAGKTCVPHSANHSMLLLFTMHLYNAIDNPAPFLEYSIEDILGQDWFLNMYEPTIKVEDGKIRVPDGPGWGIRVRTDWLENADYQVSEQS
jgi:L-alanine-DL-glutamate epimerase-like enolase superfamily enzyme